MNLIGRLLFCAFFLILCAAQTLALAPTGTLAGRITDPNDAAVRGASVEVTNPATNAVVTVQTNSEGRYVVPELQPGSYRVRITRQGFQTAVRENVTLTVAATTTANFTLQVGDVNETVTVESDITELVERDGGTVGTLVNRQFIENLPLNGRSFQSLIELAPGVVVAESSIFTPGQFSVNGQRTNSNYFTVDGVSANIGASFTAQSFQQSAGTLPGLTVLGGTNSLASVDAVQEFRVQTSTYAPEFGRQPGAQISLVTRSGTNDLTFSLFEYFRNEKLDANDWFNNNSLNPQTGRIGIPRLPLRQNQFGGTIGAPVFLPRFGEGTPFLYDGRNRTFFFFSYEGARVRQPQQGERSFRVPSVTARQTAPTNIQPILNAFPLPNSPSLPGDPVNTGRYVTLYSFPSQFDATSVRIDHRINDKVSFFGRYSNTPSSFTNRAFANGQNAYQLNTLTNTVGATWIFSPRFVNDLRVNYSTSRGLFDFEALPIDGAVLPPDGLLFPPNFGRERASASIQLFTGNPTSISQGKTLGNNQRQWNIVDTQTAIFGNHEVKFGGDFRRLTPLIDFRSIGISYNFVQSNSNPQTFRTDGKVSVGIQAFAPEGDFRVDNYSFFAQDTWRATKKLTLTYGFRYDVNPPLQGERLPYTLDSLDNLLTATLAPPNTKQFKTTYNNIAPRFGLAYAINDGFVLRGGIGKFFDLNSETVLRGYTSFPYNSNRTLNDVVFPLMPEQITPTPFNANPPYSSTFYVFDRNLKLPYTIQYNLSLEKTLWRDQTITLSYVGSRGRDLLRNETLRNQDRRNIGGVVYPAINVINPTLFGFNSTVFAIRNASESEYDAFQAQFQRRLSRGLQILASYTYSKSIDNASDGVTGNLPASGSIGYINYDLKDERGFSDFDIRHNFIAAVSYDLPRLKGNRLLAAVINGWGIDSIIRARTGSPFSVFTQAVDPLIFASSQRRADVVPGVPIYIDDANAPGGFRLNKAAFREPPVARQGNSGRNAFRSYNFNQVDLAVRRTFGIAEKLRLQFRAEAFNLFNRPNFGKPNANIGSSEALFGRASQMLNRSLGGGGTNGGFNSLYQIGGARSLQFSIKILY